MTQASKALVPQWELFLQGMPVVLLALNLLSFLFTWDGAIFALILLFFIGLIQGISALVHLVLGHRSAWRLVHLGGMALVLGSFVFWSAFGGMTGVFLVFGLSALLALGYFAGSWREANTLSQVQTDFGDERILDSRNWDNR